MVLLLITDIAAGAGQTTETVVERIAGDPAVLRDQHLLRKLKKVEPEDYLPLMRRIAAEASLPWDVRTLALTLLDEQRDATVFAGFVRDFAPVEVAADEWGDEAFNLLAAWYPRTRGGDTVLPLLIPDERRVLRAVLQNLAGRGVHTYLRLLVEHGVRLEPADITALAETDDQHTRQLLCWYVGDRRLEGMQGFLVDQIGSPRASTYRSQADHLLLAVFTVGLTEVLRTSLPSPQWLDDDATPKGLALQSLGTLLPAGTPIAERELAASLLAVAQSNAAGKDRGQWQLSIDILRFLQARGEQLAERAEPTVAALIRQVLRRRGPLEPFVAAVALHRQTGVSLPQLSPEETAAIWEITTKTLNAPFLTAVVTVLPNAERRAELEQHLLGLRDKAVHDTLRVARCWGADIETPGDWALAVAELEISPAVEPVSALLDSSWWQQAVAALVRFGPQGTPALARFLQSDQAPSLEDQLQVAAIRSCAEHLPEPEWQALLEVLRSKHHLSDAIHEMEGESQRSGS